MPKGARSRRATPGGDRPRSWMGGLAVACGLLCFGVEPRAARGADVCPEAPAADATRQDHQGYAARLESELERAGRQGRSDSATIECLARARRKDPALERFAREAAALADLERLPPDAWTVHRRALAVDIISQLALDPALGDRDFPRALGLDFARHIEGLCRAAAERKDQVSCAQALYLYVISPATREPNFGLLRAPVMRRTFADLVREHLWTPEQFARAMSSDAPSKPEDVDAIVERLATLTPDPVGGLVAWRVDALLGLAKGSAACAMIDGALDALDAGAESASVDTRLVAATALLTQAGTLRKTLGEHIDRVGEQRSDCLTPIDGLERLIRAGKEVESAASGGRSARYSRFAEAFDKAMPAYIDQLVAERARRRALSEALWMMRRPHGFAPELGLLRLASTRLEEAPEDGEAIRWTNEAFRHGRDRGLQCAAGRPGDEAVLDLLSAIYLKLSAAGVDHRLWDDLSQCLITAGYIAATEAVE